MFNKVKPKNVPTFAFGSVGIPTSLKLHRVASGRNLKLEIEYEGTNYCGWQVQSNSKKESIQAVIEKTLRKILQEKIRLIASGRTDAGVHALSQVANFKTSSTITLERLQKALNGLLPDDIVINKIEEADIDFHSRFSVKSKVYRYTLLNRSYPCALLRNRVYFYPRSLNIKLMQKESKVLLGRHNFKSFQAADKLERDSIKTIKNLKIYRRKDLIYFDIEADGFLYNMARNIVGTLIEIGRQRFKKGELKKILLAKDRRLSGPTAPARGLCLVRVNY